MFIQGITNVNYEAVYNTFSLALASMMAATAYVWFRAPAVNEKYQNAVIVAGFVTAIGAYHYMRIFNSWVDAFTYSHGIADPALTGVPFNGAFHFTHWLMTVPLLVIQILMVMQTGENKKAWAIRISVALIIVSGYYVTGENWEGWIVSICFFLYIIYEDFVGLAAAIEKEADPAIKQKLQVAGLTIFISWCTYPIVCLNPMLTGASPLAWVIIQIMYCFSDILCKCGVALVVYQIAYAKSNNDAVADLLLPK